MAPTSTTHAFNLAANKWISVLEFAGKVEAYDGIIKDPVKLDALAKAALILARHAETSTGTHGYPNDGTVYTAQQTKFMSGAMVQSALAETIAATPDIADALAWCFNACRDQSARPEITASSVAHSTPIFRLG